MRLDLGILSFYFQECKLYFLDISLLLARISYIQGIASPLNKFSNVDTITKADKLEYGSSASILFKHHAKLICRHNLICWYTVKQIQDIFIYILNIRASDSVY